MSVLIQKALQTAFHELMQHPRQGTGCPTPCHLLSCVQIVAGYGGDETTQAAAALHEIIESARWLVDRVQSEFGEPVAALVAQVTEDTRLPWHQRKQEVCNTASRCCQSVGMVLMADKLDTLLAMSRERHSAPDYWAQFHAGFADQLWFYQQLVRALRANTRVAEDSECPELRTAGLLDELTAALDRFRAGNLWTPDGLQKGRLEDVLG